MFYGPPSIETNRSAYIKAKNLLHKMPIKHELIEEDESEDFADHISAYMREHGIGEANRRLSLKLTIILRLDDRLRYQFTPGFHCLFISAD